jgi:hypothetical protein
MIGKKTARSVLTTLPYDYSRTRKVKDPRHYLGGLFRLPRVMGYRATRRGTVTQGKVGGSAHWQKLSSVALRETGLARVVCGAETGMLILKLVEIPAIVRCRFRDHRLRHGKRSLQ